MKRKRGWLAGLLFLSFLSSLFPHSPAAADAGGSHRKFVIYYGWYGDGQGKLGNDIYKIIKSAPDFVISPYHNSAGNVNLTPEVMQLYHQSGIKVLAYVATGNSYRPIENVLLEIKSAYGAGADGVMLDEVSGLNSQTEFNYYQQIYNFSRQAADKLVIANPGSILVNESIMKVADIVSFEHQWRLAPMLDWFSKYPASRFMGVSSNDITNVMGYPVDGSVASRDTIEAWQNGIGYHYATDSYTSLPSWFDDYQNTIQTYSASASKLHPLVIKTKSEDGSELSGLWVEIKRNGALVSTGFSPTHTSLPEGTYQVWASNYESYQFSKWDDGNASPLQQIDLNGNVTLTAIYKSKTISLDIDGKDSLGNHARGMSIRVIHNGVTVAAGYTPLHLLLPLGDYTVQALSYKFYQFQSWGDGYTQWSRDVQLSSDTSMTAVFNNELAGKLGTAVFGDNCYNAQNDQSIAKSLISGGPLEGTMQSYYHQSSLLSACGS